MSARKATDITQQGLATRIGKPQSFVSKYDRGERRLDIVEFVIIAKEIGLDPSGVVREIEVLVAKQQSKRKVLR